MLSNTDTSTSRGNYVARYYRDDACSFSPPTVEVAGTAGRGASTLPIEYFEMLEYNRYSSECCSDKHFTYSASAAHRKPAGRALTRRRIPQQQLEEEERAVTVALVVQKHFPNPKTAAQSGPSAWTRRAGRPITTTSSRCAQSPQGCRIRSVTCGTARRTHGSRKPQTLKIGLTEGWYIKCR